MEVPEGLGSMIQVFPSIRSEMEYAVKFACSHLSPIQGIHRGEEQPLKSILAPNAKKKIPVYVPGEQAQQQPQLYF